MRITLWCIVILQVVGACQSTPDQISASTADEAPANSRNGIDWDSVRINGQRWQETTRMELLHQLGQPTKKFAHAVECGGSLAPEGGDIWHFGSAHYEILGNRAMLMSFSPADRRFRAQLGQLRLGPGTTVAQLQAAFPAAFAGQALSNTRFEVAIPIWHGGKPTDSSLVFWFEQGRLVRVDESSAC